MSTEIKEILDNVKKCCDIMKDNNFVVYQKQDILKLLDYITNLQEDVRVGKELIAEYKKENQRLKENNQNMQLEMSRSWERIDKAIEYIEKNKMPLHLNWDEPNCDYWIATNPDDLLNILKGENND